MAIAQQYPLDTPKSNDLVIGTSIPDPNTNDDPKTVNFPVSGISALVAAEIPQGPTGAAGADGADGANGTNGFDGQDGQDGAQGPAGADGTSIKILGTKPTVGDLPTTGNTLGDLWVIDQTGGGATAGDGYVWTDGNSWLNIGPLRGPQGIQGTDGAPGSTGPAGADGTDGAPGATGAQGPQGIQGLTGATGAKGDQGEPGIPGGVSTVTQGANIVVSPNVGDVVVSAPDSVENSADIWTSTPKVTQVVTMTQAEYDTGVALNPNWLVVIVG